MKHLNVLVACAYLALASDFPNADSLVENICETTEKYGIKDECKSKAMDCITNSSDINISQITKGDQAFQHIKHCAGEIYWLPKNWAAITLGNDTQIICQKPVKGDKIYCVARPEKKLLEKFKNWDLRLARELPDICAENGGCDECKGTMGYRSADGLIEEQFPNALIFYCRLRQDKDDAAAQAPQNLKAEEDELCSTAEKPNKYGVPEDECRRQVAECVFEERQTNKTVRNFDNVVNCLDSKL